MALFKDPEKYRGQFVPVYDELLSPNEMVETFTRVTGVEARCPLHRPPPLGLLNVGGCYGACAVAHRSKDNHKRPHQELGLFKMLCWWHLVLPATKTLHPLTDFALRVDCRLRLAAQERIAST